MIIKEIKIKGYKSLNNIQINDLKKINVFYGENNTGKTNILKAIEFFFNVLGKNESIKQVYLRPLPEEFRQLFYNNENEIIMSMKLKLDESIKNEIHEKVVAYIDDVSENLKTIILNSKYLFITIYAMKFIYEKREKYFTRINTVRLDNEIIYNIEPETETPETAQVNLKSRATGIYEHPETLTDRIGNLLLPLSESFILLPEFRKFEAEVDDPEFRITHGTTVTGGNIKKALLNFSISENPMERSIYEESYRIFNVKPFDYGEISLSREPKSNRPSIEIFVKSKGNRLSIKNLGSGPQQILMIIFNVILNKNKILAIGEPEANLSPNLQKEFSNKLFDWVRMDDAIINQLFISTHSPIFKKENYYLISHDGVQTIVESPTLIGEEEFEKKDGLFWRDLKL